MMVLETQITKFVHAVEDFARCVDSLDQELFLKKFNHWSPRDVLAHLIGWNRYIIKGSKQLMRGELPFYDIDPGEDYSKVNAVLVSEYSSRDKQELLDELHSSARELKNFLLSLDSEEWERDYGVKHRGSIVTIQKTIDEFIDDYNIHKERIKEWSTRLMAQYLFKK